MADLLARALSAPSTQQARAEVCRCDDRVILDKTIESRERHAFEAPFDVRFRDHMVATTEHLMECGFQVVYGYTQSDEISLLMHRDEDLFGRKVRKYNSILAGEASAKFSLLLGDLAAFDCRVCQLPNRVLVRDYFRIECQSQHAAAWQAFHARQFRHLERQAAAGPQSLGDLIAELRAFVAQARRFIPELTISDLTAKTASGVRAQAWGRDGSLLAATGPGVPKVVSVWDLKAGGPPRVVAAAPPRPATTASPPPASTSRVAAPLNRPLPPRKSPGSGRRSS